MLQQLMRHMVPIKFKIRMDLTLWVPITSNLRTWSTKRRWLVRILTPYTLHAVPLTILTRGVVQNIRFENFFAQGSKIGPEITQDGGNNGSYSGTSMMEISSIAFVNFTGYTTGGKGIKTVSISSNVHPCYNIALRNISLASATNGTQYPAQGTCSYIWRYQWG